MKNESSAKIRSLVELFDRLTEDERIIVDVLRQIILENLPAGCGEKLSFNVPYFFGKKGICIIWPASIPRGGIKQGVLLGFWYGNRMDDRNNYLTHGTNRQIFYKIYRSPDDIDEDAIKKLLKEALRVDAQWAAARKKQIAKPSKLMRPNRKS
ncbi:MAG TPA: DUF1801 domain-containing protein [Puia sp.]|nr:DUF1801 domain-containing protein [Puia sp.]